MPILVNSTCTSKECVFCYRYVEYCINVNKVRLTGSVAQVFYILFRLRVLLIAEREVLKSLIVIVDLSISLFIRFCFIYFMLCY